MERNNKKLVVYYSYTGHTKTIAEKISEMLQCDIVEIKPVEEYSKDYDIVVREEQNSQSRGRKREIEDIKVDLNNYDEIIIGTPVWWYRNSTCH